jgi:hypothetical protein
MEFHPAGLAERWVLGPSPRMTPGVVAVACSPRGASASFIGSFEEITIQVYPTEEALPKLVAAAGEGDTPEGSKQCTPRWSSPIR